MKSLIKSFLKKYAPASVMRAVMHVRLLRTYLRDLRRYGKYCRVMGVGEHQEHLEALLVKTAHSLERGLALKETRPLFGAEKIQNIDRFLREWNRRNYDCDCMEYRMVMGALREYVAWHRERGIDPEEKYPMLAKWASVDSPNEDGGVRLVHLAELQKKIRAGLAEGVFSRHSVRHFEKGKIPLETILSAVRMAQRAPSVCNRQGGRVHIIQDETEVREALEIQGGAGGFVSDVAAVLVVTADLRVFNGVTERNQPYVDGGLFAMLLMLGLHNEGLGACPLNWCASAAKDQRFRRRFPIPDDEVILMLLGVGILPERFNVAASPRKPIAEIAQVIPARDSGAT